MWKEGYTSQHLKPHHYVRTGRYNRTTQYTNRPRMTPRARRRTLNYKRVGYRRQHIAFLIKQTQPNEPTPNETHRVVSSLLITRDILRETIHYMGQPTRKRWDTHGSKRHGLAGGGISNGEFRIPSCVHGPQQVHNAKTMACAIASHPAQLDRWRQG